MLFAQKIEPQETSNSWVGLNFYTVRLNVVPSVNTRQIYTLIIFPQNMLLQCLKFRPGILLILEHRSKRRQVAKTEDI